MFGFNKIKGYKNLSIFDVTFKEKQRISARDFFTFE